ncbi:MAG: DsbA family protein [Proteobacteria bacterium]|nr:DsbA family protein [Pseudomonadota bacterium]MBU4297581.1 DsbA family protein [Pseudomonadota bacterium]MCG2748847.1 DsbA family protein [Desulfobulbaceae bacterium]
MKHLVKIMLAFLLAFLALPAWAENENKQNDGDYVLQKTKFEVTYGNPAAPVVLTEYSSFTCPHCKNFHAQIIDKIMAPYIDTGMVYYVFRYFPLNNQALKASMLVQCLPDIEPKRLFVTALFKNQSEWAFVNTEQEFMKKIEAVAKANNIGTSGFADCTANENLADQLLKARAQASSKAHIRSTPTVFINKEKYVDNRQLEPFIAALDKVLLEDGYAVKTGMEEAREQK